MYIFTYLVGKTTLCFLFEVGVVRDQEEMIAENQWLVLESTPYDFRSRSSRIFVRQ